MESGLQVLVWEMRVLAWLQWVASIQELGRCVCVSCSVVSDFLQSHGLSTEFSRQEYWSGLPSPSPGDLPNPGIESGSPALQADSLPSELPGKPWVTANHCLISKPPWMGPYCFFFLFTVSLRKVMFSGPWLSHLSFTSELRLVVWMHRLNIPPEGHTAHPDPAFPSPASFPGEHGLPCCLCSCGPFLRHPLQAEPRLSWSSWDSK